MKIDRRLNLVLEVTREDGSTIYVHHTPISKEVYEANFMFITRVLVSMYAQGLPLGSCMLVAMLQMKKLAEQMDQASNTKPTVAALENNLLPEIWRLTNVVMPGDRGWTTLPFEMAAKTMDPEDLAEVQNNICFFTAASWVHPRRERKSLYEGLDSVMQTVSLNCTEFAASLPTSMPGANTGEKAVPSSFPT